MGKEGEIGTGNRLVGVPPIRLLTPGNQVIGGAILSINAVTEVKL
jgi:hypothetical protein